MKMATRNMAARGGLAAAWVAGAALAGGCAQPDEKVVRYKPFFTGIAGAEFRGAEPVDPNHNYVDPTAVKQADDKVITKLADGRKVVNAPNVRAMMSALEQALDEGEDALILEQIVSERTVEEFRAAHRDQAEIVDFLHKNRKPIAQLFARMPMAEHTPTVVLDQPGDKVWVIRLTGAATRDMTFTSLWVRLEGRAWRFVWVK